MTTGKSRRLVSAVFVILTAFGLFVSSSAIAGDSGYSRYFTSGALRIDLYHVGNAESEEYILDKIFKEPVWAGNPANLLDTLNLGNYMVRVFDLETSRLIYSAGYCAMFGEWQTTDEAAKVKRTFEESVIIPFPKHKVQVRIDRRDRENIFHNIYDTVVDPSDYHISTEKRHRDFRVVNIVDNGDYRKKVDLVIIGDGYTANELHKMRSDAKRLVKVLFDTEPYKSRKRDFNVRLVEAVSAESGVDEPRKGRYRDSALGFSFNAFDIKRYMLSSNNKAIRDAASRAPYDAIIVIVNTGRYGGGGIFNLYAVSSVDNEYSGYVFTHELGHSFAGLADEYYSSKVAYNDMYPRGVEPWEPNITALLDPKHIKWGDLIKPGTPIPTPDDSLYDGVVGCFEGAGYAAKGLYRSYRTCRMFAKGLVDFCPVCQRAINKRIDFFTE